MILTTAIKLYRLEGSLYQIVHVGTSYGEGMKQCKQLITHDIICVCKPLSRKDNGKTSNDGYQKH